MWVASCLATGRRVRGDKRYWDGAGRAAQKRTGFLSLGLSQLHHQPRGIRPLPISITRLVNCGEMAFGASGRALDQWLCCIRGPACWRSACAQQMSCRSKYSEAGNQGGTPTTPTWQKLATLVASVLFGFFCFASFPPWCDAPLAHASLQYLLRPD